MKLFVLFWLNPGHDPNDFKGIYSTMELAEAAKTKLLTREPNETPDSYGISEVELDADPDSVDPRAVFDDGSK